MIEHQMKPEKSSSHNGVEVLFLEKLNVGTWRWPRTNPKSQTTSQEKDTKNLRRFDKIAHISEHNREISIDD